jgi:hypothetical protein
MAMMRATPLLAAAGLAAVALPAQAQEPSQAAAAVAMAQPEAEADWTLLRDQRQNSIIAYIPVTTGLMLAVRCTDGALDGVITGLPAHPRGQPTRALGLAFGTERMHQTRWSVTTDPTVAISDYPARFARSLKRGGQLKILIPGGAPDGRNLLHDLTLPASGSAIEQTLNACGRPLDDPRDDLLPDIGESGLPAGVRWAERPRISYPNTFLAAGYAVVSCVAQTDGSLDDCQLESEQPPRSRFGAAALRAARDARIEVDPAPGTSALPRMISFRANFTDRSAAPRRNN